MKTGDLLSTPSQYINHSTLINPRVYRLPGTTGVAGTAPGAAATAGVAGGTAPATTGAPGTTAGTAGVPAAAAAGVDSVVARLVASSALGAVVISGPVFFLAFGSSTGVSMAGTALSAALVLAAVVLAAVGVLAAAAPLSRLL